MSIYPSFTKTDDTSSEKLSIDLSNFVQSSNAVFDTDVYMKNGSKINYSGKISKAFGQDDEDMLLSCDDKLSKITYDDGTGTTTIKDTLDISSAAVFF